MLITIAPWLPSVGVAAIFGAVAFVLAFHFPEKSGLIRITVFSLSCIYGLFALGEIHSAIIFGSMFWFFILYFFLITFIVYLYNNRFGL